MIRVGFYLFLWLQVSVCKYTRWYKIIHDLINVYTHHTHVKILLTHNHTTHGLYFLTLSGQKTFQWHSCNQLNTCTYSKCKVNKVSTSTSDQKDNKKNIKNIKSIKV